MYAEFSGMTPRAAENHYTSLEVYHKLRIRKQEQMGTGSSPTHSKVDLLMEELITLNADSSASNKKRKRVEEQEKKGEAVRERALNTFRQKKTLTGK